MAGIIIDKRIIPLAVGGLGIGTTEFAIMGILPDIASSLNVSIPDAGHFISAYALGVVIGAPLIIGNSIKFPPKKVLMSLMILFTVFNGLSAIASNYSFMVLSRFLSGLPHGAFFGVSTVVATRLADVDKKARYVAMAFSGLTIANLVMVPLITYIGHTFHWSWCFVIVSAIGLITILLIHLWVPEMQEGVDEKWSKKLSFLKSAETWHVLLLIAIGFGGLFAWLSYITPLMTDVSGIKPENVAYVMILAGSGMVIGNVLGGTLTDRLGAANTALLLFSLMMISLIGVFLYSANPVVSLILTFICGALCMSTISPITLMILRAAPGAEMMSSAFVQAAYNIANSLGAYLGGIPLIYGLSFSYPSLVGAGMTLLGVIISIRYALVYGQRSKKVAIEKIESSQSIID